jgi:hypothetical protein
VNFKEDGLDVRAVQTWQHLDSPEVRVLPAQSSNPTAEFLYALFTLVTLIVTLPACLALSVALAVALYIRCAGVLLSPNSRLIHRACR